MRFSKKEMLELFGRGLTQSQVALSVGCSKSNVNQRLGSNCDTEQWEQERQRHANFFAGLTPQQEYDLHTKRRKEMDDE